MGHSHPKVSVGLPVYNGERYLSEAIDSLLAQTYQDFEIIITDNASTDGTEAICRDFQHQDQRIRYFRNGQNIGAAANFNLSFKLGSGTYFKWAAHDDICGSDFLTRCVEVLDGDESVVLAYPKAMIIDSTGKELEPYDLKLPTDSNRAHVRFASLLRGHKCFEVFGLIRRNALVKTALIGSYAHGDGILLSRLAFIGRFEEIPEYLFFPRRHPEQSMSMLGEYRRYAAWFNPEYTNRMVFPWWRMHLEFFRSIHSAPLDWLDILRCYRILARSIYRRRRLLFDDISFQVDRLKKLNADKGSKAS